MRQPFTEDDDPEYAATIDANEPWYRAILDSEPPLDSPAWLHLLPKAPDESFHFRAMLAFGRGDHAKGIESLQYLSRLGKAQLKWGTDANFLVHVSRHSRACAEVVPSALFAMDRIPRDLRELAFDVSEPAPTPRIAANLLDKAERYHQLIYLASANPYTTSIETLLLSSPNRLDTESGIRTNWFLHRVDWRRFAHRYHRFVDGLVERVAIDNDRKRTEAIRDYRSHYLSQFEDNQPDLASWSDVLTGNVTRIPEVKLGKMFWFVESQLNYDRCKRRQIRLAVYLARFRNEHKRFPSSLEALSPYVSPEHRDALRDNNTDEPWQYETDGEGKGFVLKRPGEKWTEMQWPPPDTSPSHSRQHAP